MGHLGTVDGLFLEERLGHQIESGPVLDEQVVGALLLVVEDPRHFVVDASGGLVAVPATAW